MQTGAKVQTIVPVNPAVRTRSHPAAEDEPCHAYGRQPVSSMRRGGGSTPATTILYRQSGLQGRDRSRGCWDTVRKISDFPVHRTFARVKVEIGRCEVCGEKKAVYQSREAQAGVWEERLARAPRAAGVRAPPGAVNVYHWEDTNVNVTTEERIARNSLILLSGCERSVPAYPEIKRVVRSGRMTLKRDIK